MKGCHNRTDVQPARGTDFALDTPIFVKDVIHNDVIVETTNEKMLKTIKDLRDQLRQDGKDAFMHVFRSISSAVRDANTDTLYKGKRMGKKRAIKEWQNLCDDIVLLAACRHVLWRKPVPIRVDVEEWQKM